MTSGNGSAVQAGDLYGVMMRRAAPWALGAALACVIGYTATMGRTGFASAGLGLMIVFAFYAIDVAVLGVMRRAAPELTVLAVLIEYGVKVVALAALLWSLRDSSVVDLQATAVTVVVTTITWVIALTTVAFRSRSFVLDPAPKPRGPGEDERRNRP